MESCSPRNVAPGLSAAYSISYAFIRSTMMSEPYAALERPDVAATRSTAWTSWPSLIANLRSAYVESPHHPTLSTLKGERKEWKVSLLFFWLRATQPAQLFAGQRSHQGAEPVRQRRLGACFKCDLHGLGKIFVRPGQVDEVEFSQRVTVGAAVPQRGAQPRRGNAQPLCQRQGFVNARHAGPQDEVVGQFGNLPRADLGVDMNDLLTERPQDRLAPLEERRLTADEHGQVAGFGAALSFGDRRIDRKSTRLNSSHLVISYAVFCLKKKKKK